MSEWPEIWGEASWALDRTNHGLLFEFWSRLGSRRCLTWFHRAEDVELWCTVIRCPIDLKFDGEPIGVILRWSISSDLGAMVPGSFAAGRLDFASEHQNLVKRCRNDLKFDVQPFGSMQKLLMCFFMSGGIRGSRRREAWFRRSRVDGGSNGVGLTWNSTWSLLEVFWDHP